MITDFESLIKTLSKQEKRRIVIANGVDKHSIEAAIIAEKMKIVSIILTGKKSLIVETCKKEGISINQIDIIDCPDDQAAVDKAVELATNKKADIIMKGMISTDVFVKSILRKETGLLPEGSLLSHITVIKNKHYPKLLFVSDVAIIPNPTLDQKKIMTLNLIVAAHKFGIEKPKVAFIAATEKVIQKMQSTVDAAGLKELWIRGEFPDSYCDGPMALDLAIDPESVQSKCFISHVAGNADCLLFHNLEAGNVFYKTNTKLSNARTGAIVVGTTIPVVLSSRGDSIDTKLNSIALAALLG